MKSAADKAVDKAAADKAAAELLPAPSPGELHKAAEAGELEAVCGLLDRGAAVDAKDQVSGIPCVCTGQAGCTLKGGWREALFEEDAA